MPRTLEENLNLMDKIATEGYEHSTTRAAPARAFKRIIGLIETIKNENSTKDG